MTREEKVQQWLIIAERDLDAAEWMHQGGRWLYVAFECHQALEKLIKAYWTGTREDDRSTYTITGAFSEVANWQIN